MSVLDNYGLYGSSLYYSPIRNNMKTRYLFVFCPHFLTIMVFFVAVTPNLT